MNFKNLKTKKKSVLFISLLLMILLVIPSIASATDYTYWNTHYLDANNGNIISGANPATYIIPLYTDTLFTTRTPTQICTALGMTVGSAQHSMRANNIGGGAGLSYGYDSIAPFTNPDKYGVVHGSNIHWWKDNGATDSGAIALSDGFGANPTAYCNGAYRNDPTYFMVYHATASPDFDGSFTGTPTSGIPVLSVQFNLSYGYGAVIPNFFVWNFGDGNFTSNYARNATHAYTTMGTYTVSVTYGNTTTAKNTTITNTNYITVTPSSLSLVVTPTSIYQGQNASIQVLGSAVNPPLNSIFYWDFEDQNITVSNPISIAKYRNVSGTWQKYTNNTWQVTADNIQYIPIYQPSTTGIHHIKVNAYSTYNTIAALDTTLTVLDAGGIPMILGAIDGNGNHLSDYNLNLCDMQTSLCRNLTINYDMTMSLSSGKDYSMQGYKSGYLPSNWLNFTVPFVRNTFSNYQNVILYAQGTNLDTEGNAIPIGGLAANSSITINTVDEKNNIVGNAFVKVDYSTYGEVGQPSHTKNVYSDATTGTAFFLIPFNSTCYFTATKSGYNAGTTYVSTSKQYTWSKTITMQTITGAHTINATPTYTIIPTPTVYTTVTGGVVINGSFCKDPTNIMEGIDYPLCTNGITNPIMRDLLKAFVLIIVIACIGGIVTRGENGGIGFIGGAALGFVGAIAIGWIAWYILIVFLLLGLLIVILLRRQ